ncbi:MAG TPA: peptidoglycan-binding domain-containing protein [Mycobacterium sp.]
MLLGLQRTAGNRAVSALLVQRCGPLNPDCSCPEEDKQQAAAAAVQRLTDIERQQDLNSERLASDPRLQAAFDNSPAMRVGERGDAVRRVQEVLVGDGLVMPRSTTPAGQLDGRFGGETRDTVRQFQSRHAADGLLDNKGTADGVVGRKTLAKMDELSGPGPGPLPNVLPPCPAPVSDAENLAAPPTAPGLDSAPIPGVTCDPNSTKPAGDPHACVVSEDFPFNRSGIVRSAAGLVGESFEMNVEWASAPPQSRNPQSSFCAAECGEYHQFVKGHMLASPNKDGSKPQDVSASLFGGAKLDPTTFQEDGLDRKPQARYGHRKEPTTMNEKYEPDRLTGTKYFGKDFPNVSTGTFADIDLTFLGKTIDTCNGIETSNKTWAVKFRGIIRP